MSLDKAITHGKEKRKPYRGSKAIDYTCRNHGSCLWCVRNRKHKMRDKHPADKGGQVMVEFTKLTDDLAQRIANYKREHPKTNADRIRTMSDEELARWINFHTDCENCPNRGCADPYNNPNFCVNSLLSWLKSPVEVDK